MPEQEKMPEDGNTGMNERSGEETDGKTAHSVHFFLKDIDLWNYKNIFQNIIFTFRSHKTII